ncbi:MAG: hypothetical protein M0C28_44070 [Candidatus Moduliflexus flocculans]|nr:hypothetical protein [Candidatus Moduliflexus flocculans]
MIVAPTATPNVTPTATIDPFAPSPTPTGLAVGTYAQITRHGGRRFAHPFRAGLDRDSRSSWALTRRSSSCRTVRARRMDTSGGSSSRPMINARAGWAAANFLTYIPRRDNKVVAE